MFSFIILHYKNIEETICCLNYITKNNYNDYHIIIVDNNTLNSNEEKQIRKYTNDIIKLSDNLGFAKANNIGIKYAEKKYNSMFYIVINNDVYIYQKDFLKIIKDDYKKYKFDMLGPKIDSPSGESVNPFPAIKLKSEVKKEINYCNKLIKIYQSNILTFLLDTYLKLKYLFLNKPKVENGKNVVMNVPLHCCAIVFSKEYVEKYTDTFNSCTFLFHEEEFLYQRLIKNNLISIYDPRLEVFHKEGSSTKASFKNKRLRRLFHEKERKKSLEKLLEIV